MTTKKEFSPQMQQFVSLLPAVRTVDADTVADAEGPIRFLGLNAPEVQHITPDGLKRADWGGEFYKDLYERLWTESGYDKPYRSGKQGYYGRDLGGLENEYGRSFADKAVYEGVSIPTNETQREIWELGLFERAFNKDVAGVEEDDIWAQARKEIDDYKTESFVGLKQTALDETELREYKDHYGESYSPFYSHQVKFRRPGRDLDDEPTSDWGGGWNFGWQSIKESSNNAIAALGDTFDSQYLFDVGRQRAEESKWRLGNMPRLKNDFTEVKDFSDLVDWGQTSLGVALPYMLGIIASGLTGAVVTASAPLTGVLGTVFGAGLSWQLPMAWVYSGEVYGNMEGDMDQRNAATAWAGGIAMAWLDKAGLHGLFRAGQVLKKDGMEQVAKAYAKENGVSLQAAREETKHLLHGVIKGSMKDLKKIATLQMSKTLLAKQITKGVGAGATFEGITEMGQESISYQFGRWGTDEDIRKPFDADEYRRILANAAAGGILLGGGIRGTSTATSEIGGFKTLQRRLRTDAKIAAGWEGNTLDENYDKMVPETATVEDSSPQTPVQSSPAYGTPEYYNQRSQPESAGAKPLTVQEEMKAEKAKGEHEDKSRIRGGAKTIVTTLKEFGKRFTQKPGSLWEDRILNNPNLSPKAKMAFKLIQAIAGSGKLSYMQAVDLFETKRRLQASMMHEVHSIREDLYKFLGVGIQVSKGVYSGKTKQEANDFFLEYLRERESKNINQVSPKFKGFEKQLEEFRERVGSQYEGQKGITENLHDSVSGLLNGAVPRKKAFWFQRSTRLKKDVVLENKEEFLEILEEKGWTKDQALQFFDMIENGPAGYDLSQVSELGFMNFPARSLKTTKGVLEKTFGEKSKFLENDPFQRLMENIQEQTNYAVDRKYLGKNGSRFNKLLKILKDEMGEDWDSRIAAHFSNSIAASRGDYRRLKSKRLERWIGHITFFNTFGHLDLSALASLPEAAIVLLGATKDKQIMPLIEQGVKEFSEKLRNEVSDNWTYINPKAGVIRKKYLRNLTDFYRYGYDTGAHGAIGQVGIDEAVYKASKIKEAVMKAFFTVNLLKVYTDATRVARLSLANDIIFGDLEIIGMYPPGSAERSTGLFVDAFERLRELNIDPDEAAKRYSNLLVLARLHLGKGATAEALYEEMVGRDPKFLETMDIARMSFVDNAIAHPTAMNRPIWYSNPAYRVFTQYNGFMSVFTAHLLPKIWRRIKGADPTAKYNAVAVAVSMLALGFLSQMLKDEWRYDGKPSWISDKGYIQRGVSSSGLLGTPEKILAAVSPLYDMSKQWHESRMDNILKRTGHGITDLMGPTWAHGEQLSKIMLNALEGDESRWKFYASKEIPFLGKMSDWKEYNLGANDKGIDLEQALKNSVPSFPNPL